MNAKDIISNKLTAMGEPFDNVTVVSETEIDKGNDRVWLVVCDIHYMEDDSKMRVPFMVYDEEGVFMPGDWQGALPESEKDAEEYDDWVTMPNGHPSVMMNGLPRLFAGEF